LQAGDSFLRPELRSKSSVVTVLAAGVDTVAGKDVTVVAVKGTPQPATDPVA